MSRTLWFAAGTGVGLYAAARARRLAETFTAEGLQDRVGAAVVGLRMFRDEVAQGKADAETGLRERMGLALHEHHELTSSARHELAGTEPDPAPSIEKEVGSS
ncbi:DUF6167 family protein [Nocardioides sp. C4-1]|uniref:DUF6167 family protein n=1 Tax=Nocardioides sp. C4-1 TaxID=3151851 RepID=UPI00326470CC